MLILLEREKSTIPNFKIEFAGIVFCKIKPSMRRYSIKTEVFVMVCLLRLCHFYVIVMVYYFALIL